MACEGSRCKARPLQGMPTAITHFAAHANFFTRRRTCLILAARRQLADVTAQLRNAVLRASKSPLQTFLLMACSRARVRSAVPRSLSPCLLACCPCVTQCHHQA